jgi:hypothetical protein
VLFNRDSNTLENAFDTRLGIFCATATQIVLFATKMFLKKYKTDTSENLSRVVSLRSNSFDRRNQIAIATATTVIVVARAAVVRVERRREQAADSLPVLRTKRRQVFACVTGGNGYVQTLTTKRGEIQRCDGAPHVLYGLRCALGIGEARIEEQVERH